MGLFPIQTPLITVERVKEYQSKSPKRICFASTHKTALRPDRNPLSKYVGAFNVPFGETIRYVFPYDIFPDTRNKFHSDAYWRSIENKAELEEIRSWIERQEERIFLRDCLYTSIALSLNYADKNERRFTAVGHLEEQAKKYGDNNAASTLAGKCVDAIKSYPLYLQADVVSAVPPSLGKEPEKDLPSKIAALVARQIGKPDVTVNFLANKPKNQVKTLALDARWMEWVNTGLVYNGDLKEKTVILIDDKYQSGTSIQYVAMKLQEAGAHQVYGLCLVKTMRDTDNQ